MQAGFGEGTEAWTLSVSMDTQAPVLIASQIEDCFRDTEKHRREEANGA